MSRAGAETAVTMSAVGVFGIFAYRKITESVSQLPQSVPQTGHFLLGWMVTFITLSMVAAAAPELGGMFALLVFVGDLLTNGQQIVKDINTGLQTTANATGAGSFATFTPTTTTSA